MSIPEHSAFPAERAFPSHLNRKIPGGSESRRPGRPAPIAWWLHSKMHPARHVALAMVALFDLWEVSLLWTRGLQGHNVLPLTLGCMVLLLLVGFELDESAAMRRERELAREIAAWLMPRVPPSIPHLEVAFRSRRVDRVAGDYFNIFPRWPFHEEADGRRVFVAMADVAGLGIQGALLMATFQASLRALADTRLPLDDLAHQMNQWSLDRSVEGRHFVMAFFADLKPETGEIRFVNAGHQPPMILRAAGPVEELELRGFPLGVADGSRYEVGTAALAAGDALVIITDGAPGVVNHRGEPFGRERVRACLANAHGHGAGEMLDGILTAVLSFAGTARQQDDISVVVLKRTS